MVYLKNRIIRSVCYVFVVIGILILNNNAEAAISTVGFTNAGNTDVKYATVYRVGPDSWQTKGWWTHKPDPREIFGLRRKVTIETGIRNSFDYYFAFHMTNDKGEAGHPRDMKINVSCLTRNNAPCPSDTSKKIKKFFCVNTNGPTNRISSFRDLDNCPPGYELAPFTLKIRVPRVYGTWKASADITVYPDKSNSDWLPDGAKSSKKPANSTKKSGIPGNSSSVVSPDRPKSGRDKSPPLSKEKHTRFSWSAYTKFNSNTLQDAFIAMVKRINSEGHKTLVCVYGPSRPNGTGFRSYSFWYKKVPLLTEEIRKLPPDFFWRNLGRRALEKCPENNTKAEKTRQENWSAWDQRWR